MFAAIIILLLLSQCRLSLIREQLEPEETPTPEDSYHESLRSETIEFSDPSDSDYYDANSETESDTDPSLPKPRYLTLIPYMMTAVTQI